MRMNYAQFMKKVDSFTEKLSKEEIRGFVHEIARTLPEAKRESFFEKISLIVQNSTDIKDADTENETNCGASADLLTRCQEIQKKLEDIEDQKIGLVGYFNKNYDEWYDDDEEEFLFEDPEGVEDVICQACVLAHQCIDHEIYLPVCNMAEILVGLEITVEGEYQEYIDTPLDVNELQDHGLGHFDYRQFILEALYAAYFNEKADYRAEALYNMIENSQRKDITLEMVIQNVGELPDIKSFLPQWITFLGSRMSSNAQRLLKEAMELIDDPDQLLENARRFSVQHPGLYEQYFLISMKDEKTAKLLETGNEALEAIDTKYLVRSRIALMCSKAALTDGKQAEAERYWLEAFRSDTRVEGYLRLLMETRDFSVYEEKVKQIYESMCGRVKADEYRFTSSGELEENLADRKNIGMIGFFCGDFEYIKNSAMDKKEALGWSMSFMKCGLAAFLLLLYEGEKLQQGGLEMCKTIVSSVEFDKEQYQKGTDRRIEESSEEWFGNCFAVWKKKVILSDSEKEEYLVWLKELVTRRVEGIMDGSKRNYYGECAGFIAALAEVIESRGECGGKQRVMSEYMGMYSRRWAFREELCKFGMMDPKKAKH